MPFPIALVAAAGSAAMGAAGSNAAMAATKEGAQSQANVEEMSRQYQRKLFDEEMERLRPYHETAVQEGLPLMQQYLSEGGIDQSQMPLYNMQMDAAMSGLEGQGVGDYGMNRYRDSLSAAENDAGYARLQDMMQIGMGASGAAGQGAGNFATGQAQSFINSGNALARANMQANNMQNSMYGDLADQFSSIPAYASQRAYNNQWKANQYENSPDFVGPPKPNRY